MSFPRAFHSFLIKTLALPSDPIRMVLGLSGDLGGDDSSSGAGPEYRPHPSTVVKIGLNEYILAMQDVILRQMSSRVVQATNAAVAAGYFDRFEQADAGSEKRANDNKDWQDHRYRMIECASWNMVSRVADMGIFSPTQLKDVLHWAADDR